MASVTSSPSTPHHQSSPHCLSTPTDDDSQRGRKRRRSSAAEHVSSNGSTNLRGRGRYRSPSLSSLTGQHERVRDKSPERKAKRKFLGGLGRFTLGLGGREVKRGQSSSCDGERRREENQGVVGREGAPELRSRSHGARDRDGTPEDEDGDGDEHAGEKNAEKSEAGSAIKA
ncbi:hypothetical protein JHW43_001749 [Diplocarpon mali]|nr:hypothetical protein JHW43_001749 [Diplocarpon mali]